MLSQSVRHAGLWESSFRVQSPNSAARNILVVALEATSARLGLRLDEHPWRRTQFVNFEPHNMSNAAGAENWRAALDRTDLDLVVIVGSIGQNLSAVAAIGEACVLKDVKVSGVLVADSEAEPGLISAGLRMMRPWTHTLAVISDGACLADLLHALGA